MKKTVILLITAALLVTACNEQDTNQQPTPEMTQTRETEPPQTRPALTETHETEPPPTEQPRFESRLPVNERVFSDRQCWYYGTEYMLLYAFPDGWLNVTNYYEGVLLERAWDERYRDKLGATFDEAYDEFYHHFTRLASIPMDEWVDTIECEIFQAYRSLRSDELFLNEFWDMRDRGNSWVKTWENANNPVFLELLYHFNVTKEEFRREYERVLRNLAYLEIIDPDYDWAWSLVIFPIEHIDVLFSGDDTAIKRAALNPWSIMVEDRVYPAQWLMDNSPADWAEAGIELNDAQRMLDVLSNADVLATNEIAEFEAELDVFRREYATR
jgi:hypothetical protein